TRNLSFPRRPREDRRKWPFFLPPAAPPFRRIASAPAPRHLFRRHLRSSETFLCLDWAPPWTQLKQPEKCSWRGSFRCEPAMPPPPRAVKVQGRIIPAILPLIPVQRTALPLKHAALSGSGKTPCNGVR